MSNSWGGQNVSCRSVRAYLPLVSCSQVHGFDVVYRGRPQLIVRETHVRHRHVTPCPGPTGGWCDSRECGKRDEAPDIFSELDRTGIFTTKKRARHDRVMAMSTSKGKRRDGGVDSIWNVMMISTWLCIAHIALAMLAVSLFFLPHPVAVGTLAILVALAVLPVRRPFPRWGIAIARAITYGALDYFPMSLEWEDQASFVDAAVKGTPSIIGCEPHGVLPLSIISFADYCYYGADTPSIVKLAGHRPHITRAHAGFARARAERALDPGRSRRVPAHDPFVRGGVPSKAVRVREVGDADRRAARPGVFVRSDAHVLVLEVGSAAVLGRDDVCAVQGHRPRAHGVLGQVGHPNATSGEGAHGCW